MYQKAMTGCLLIALHRVFLRVNWLLFQTNCNLTRRTNECYSFEQTKLKTLFLGPSLLYSIAAIHQRACLTFNYKCSAVYIKKYTTKQWKKLVIKTVTLTYLSRRKQATSASLLKAFSCISYPDINPCFCNLRSRFLLRSYFGLFRRRWLVILWLNRAVQPFKLAAAVTSASLCSAPPLLLTFWTKTRCGNALA